MPRIFSTWPKPILLKGFTGDGFLELNFSHKGFKTLSSRATKMLAEIMTTTGTVPAGILKWGPRCRSMTRAWRTAVLLRTASGVLRRMAVDHMGKTLMTVLRSSTFCTVQRLHGFAMGASAEVVSPVKVLRAARLKNLAGGRKEWIASVLIN